MKCPFGLLFAEPLIKEEKLPQSAYDEGKDITVTEDKGHVVPLITSSPWTLGTFTETRVMGEHTDADD